MTNDNAPRTKIRRSLITEPRLQLSLSLGALATTFIISALLLGIVYYLFHQANAEYATRYPELVDQLAAENQRILKLILAYGFVTSIVFAVPVLVLVIFFTNRVAGPVRKTIGYLGRLQETPGDIGKTNLSFRNNDYFLQLATAINEFTTHVANQGAQESSGEETGSSS